MKKLLKTLAVLAFTSTVALANISPEHSFKVGMYNIKNTHKVRVFIEKDNLRSLTLEIFDEDGRQIQKDFLGKDKTKLGLDLDLSKLNDGQYTLRISDKNGVYNKKIEVKKEKIEELKIVI